MRTVMRSRELQKLDAIFNRTRQRSFRVLSSVLWLRDCKAEAVRVAPPVHQIASMRRSPIDYGLRPRGG